MAGVARKIEEAVTIDVIELPGAVEKCTGCNVCVRECSFLKRVGNPAKVAGGAACDPFECTLCGLCTAVCPVDVDPSAYFLQRRVEARHARGGDDPRHAPLIAYERKGTSRLFTFYGLPSGCDTIFFPGCALPGTRPKAVLEVYQRLTEEIPSLGIVLDCCLKPSHDLGRREHFHQVFGEMLEYLVSHGVRNVLVACPNCHRMFSQYGGGLAVRTVYELLEEAPHQAAVEGTEVVVHDPCVSRFAPDVQRAARELAGRSGVTVSEMKRSGARTICCGRGGGANFIDPQVMQDAVASRAAEAQGRPMVTYCAACAGTFAPKTKTVHLLDLWLTPDKALAGKVKVSAAPFTYLNRLLLKRKLKKKKGFAVTRERRL